MDFIKVKNFVIAFNLLILLVVVSLGGSEIGSPGPHLTSKMVPLSSLS